MMTMVLARLDMLDDVQTCLTMMEVRLAPPPPPQPSAPPTAQAGQEDMGRGKRKRSVPVNSPPAATTTPSVVAHGRRAGLRVRKRNV